MIFYKAHPEKLRDKAEYEEMDKKNKITCNLVKGKIEILSQEKFK